MKPSLFVFGLAVLAAGLYSRLNALNASGIIIILISLFAGKKEKPAPSKPFEAIASTHETSCINCGEKLEADDRYCPGCGKKTSP